MHVLCPVVPVYQKFRTGMTELKSVMLIIFSLLVNKRCMENYPLELNSFLPYNFEMIKVKVPYTSLLL